MKVSLRKFLLWVCLVPSVFAGELGKLPLAESEIVLVAPAGWGVVEKGFMEGISPPDQPAEGSTKRIHFARPKNAEETLEETIETEIDDITEKGPGSSNSREHYKGSEPVRTKSGLEGLRADFHFDFPDEKPPRIVYHIVKYYFLDEKGEVFKVCSHVYGDEEQFRLFEAVILDGLNSSAGGE